MRSTIETRLVSSGQDHRRLEHPVQLTTYRAHGLPDLNPNNPDVYSYLLSSSRLQLPV